jgi:release factor glutamine methyltransferase
MSDLHCTWRDMLLEAAGRLRAAGIEGAQRDAKLLLADALGIEQPELIVREMDAIDGAGLAEFEARVQRRLKGEPVSRIRGWREFYGRRFIVTPDVLDPRPETELLVGEGLARLPFGGRVLDLGTGSGCILVSVLAERADAMGLGVDISPGALDVARRNAAALGVAGRSEFVLGGWEVDAGEFDLVLSNPPYVDAAEIDGLARDVREFDPRIALTAGEGLGAYREILAAMPGWLKPGGWLGVEFGMGQGEDVGGLMADAGLSDVDLFTDLSGTIRAAFGRR